jgi:phosphoribosylanthranilate isomerase
MHNPYFLVDKYDRAGLPMFRIKICGVTSVADARLAVRAGAEAIGLNFYAKSKRLVDLAIARQIADAVQDQCALVGVFVNSPAEEVNRFVEHVGLNWVQLHGDEPPEFLAQVTKGARLLRVYRLGVDGSDPIVADIEKCRRCGRGPDALLVDAAVAGEYGGTGSTLNWDRLPDFAQAIRTRIGRELPLLLAGGLTPENVASAIRQARPSGVDVASGVESAPGVKDPDKVRLFISSALRELGCR